MVRDKVALAQLCGVDARLENRLANDSRFGAMPKPLLR
jgi:hypothetical protein